MAQVSELTQVQRSEAVYLDAVSDDARSAFVLRLCRYPQAHRSWGWLHVFHEGEVFAYVDHDMPCTLAITPLDAPDVTYEAATAQAHIRFDRVGPVGAPVLVRAFADIVPTMLAGGPQAADESAGRVLLQGRFQSNRPPVSNRDGRYEILGRTEATINWEGRAIVIQAYGHFHEQEQTDPRFVAAFTYGSLRSDDGGLIFIRGTRGVRGQFIEADQSVAIARIDLTRPADTRLIRVHLADGRVLAGRITCVWRYSVNISGEERPGSIVTVDLDGRRYSGCVNDFRVDELGFSAGFAD